MGSQSLGAYSKLRRQQLWERGKTKDLMGRTIAQHMRFKTFLSRPLQNDNLKSPKFASFSNGNRDGKLFQFPFGTCRCLHTLDWS